MIDIQLNDSKLIFGIKDGGVDLIYLIGESSITFELCKSEVSLIIDWCNEFPCEWGCYVNFGAVKFTENDNGMPLVLINKDGYKARINLTKRNLREIEQHIRGVK